VRRAALVLVVGVAMLGCGEGSTSGTKGVSGGAAGTGTMNGGAGASGTSGGAAQMSGGASGASASGGSGGTMGGASGATTGGASARGGTSSGGAGTAGASGASGGASGASLGGSSMGGASTGGMGAAAGSTSTGGAASGAPGTAGGGGGPSGPLNVLVCSRTQGFRHDSIPDGIAAFTKLATQNGWSLMATEDPTVFSDDMLGPLDVIVFMSTTGDVLDDGQQAAFERFIRAGGGFVGVHSATDTEYDWAF